MQVACIISTAHTHRPQFSHYPFHTNNRLLSNEQRQRTRTHANIGTERERKEKATLDLRIRGYGVLRYFVRYKISNEDSESLVCLLCFKWKTINLCLVSVWRRHLLTEIGILSVNLRSNERKQNQYKCKKTFLWKS